MNHDKYRSGERSCWVQLNKPAPVAWRHESQFAWGQPAGEAPMRHEHETCRQRKNAHASSDRLSFLRTEYERYSKLAEVEEEKAKAVIQQVERAVKSGKGQERVERLLTSIAAGLIVFVLGVIFGPLVRALLGFR